MPAFYDFPTVSQQLAGIHPSFIGVPWEVASQRLREEMAGMQKSVEAMNWEIVHNMLQATGVWEQNNSPVFKVHPACVSLLADAKWHVPSFRIKLPFTALLIAFREDDRFTWSGVPVRSILLSEVVLHLKLSSSVCLSILVDVGDKWCDSPLCAQAHMPLTDSATIEEHLLKMDMEFGCGHEETAYDRDSLQRMWRVVLGVAMLATGGDRLVEPDVLSKDGAAYQKAKQEDDQEKIERLVSRARRRGKVSWTVGSEVARPLFSGGSGVGANLSHGLSHSHIRRAHFRLRGDSVIFVRQTVVRPDLPPDPRRISYNLT